MTISGLDDLLFCVQSTKPMIMATMMSPKMVNFFLNDPFARLEFGLDICVMIHPYKLTFMRYADLNVDCQNLCWLGYAFEWVDAQNVDFEPDLL